MITRGEGIYLHDAAGAKLLDGMSGLWCVAVGYGREELVEAAEEQLLIRRIEGVDLSPFKFQGWEGKRLTHTFGWRNNYLLNLS